MQYELFTVYLLHLFAQKTSYFLLKMQFKLYLGDIIKMLERNLNSKTVQKRREKFKFCKKVILKK